MGWLTGYKHRKLITIAGTADGAQTNYQLKLTTYYGAGSDSGAAVYLNSNCQTDFDDIRFTKSDGSTELDHWRESYTASTSAVFWIEFDSIPISPNTTTFYIYYGKSDAASGSNCGNTFIFGDDFDRADSATVGNDWTETNSAIESNALKVVRSGGVDETCSHAVTLTGSVYTEYKAKINVLTYNFNSLFHQSGVNQCGGWLFGATNLLSYLNNTGWISSGVTFVADTFYRFGILWDSSDSKYDYYLDGVLKASNQAPYTATLTNDVRFAVNTNNLIGYAGWLIIRKYTLNEPTWGTWGTQESIQTVGSGTISIAGALASARIYCQAVGQGTIAIAGALTKAYIQVKSVGGGAIAIVGALTILPSWTIRVFGRPLRQWIQMRWMYK